MVGLSDCGGIEKGAQWRPGALGMRLGGAKAFFQTAPKRNAAAWPHRAAIAAKRPLRRYWTSQPSTTSASAVGVMPRCASPTLSSVTTVSVWTLRHRSLGSGAAGRQAHPRSLAAAPAAGPPTHQGL